MSVVANAILFAVVCWDGRLREEDANRLHTLIGEASGWVELVVVTERMMLFKLCVSLDKVSTPHDMLLKHRRISPRCTTELDRKSFMPHHQTFRM